MAFSILAEALARIEHKIDALVRFHNIPVYPMHFQGNSCPVCYQMVDYQVDVKRQVVIRKCGCSTGKVPATIPLLPIITPHTGVPNGNPLADADRGESAEEGSGSKAR